MIQKLSAPISVAAVFDHKVRAFVPKKVLWEGREHTIIKVGLHHTFRQGRTLYHVFSAASETLFSGWFWIRRACFSDWRRLLMENLLRLPFNPKPPTIMHLDLNSCFATIEQQANPLWRDKPLAVAAYTTANGCIIAPSMEAKKGE